MDYKYLFEYAQTIPELGHGGKTTQKELICYVKDLPDDTCILDIGPWMGSTTAFLSLGVMKYKKHIKIYAIDRWKADDIYVQRAKLYNNIDLAPQSNIKHLFDEYIKPFPNIVSIRNNFINIDIEELPPISMIVDDTGGNHIKTIVDKFECLFISDFTVIVSMDYGFYPRGGKLSIAYNYFNKNLKFKQIQICKEPSKAAVYRYVG